MAVTQRRLELALGVTFFLGILTELCGGSAGVTPEVLLFAFFAVHLRAARPLLVAFVVLAATLLTDIIFLAAYSRSQAANVFSAFTFISKTATAYLCYAYVTQVLAERFSLLWTGSGGDEGSGVPAKSLTEAEGESAAMESGGVVAGSSSPQLAAPGIGGYQGYQ